MTMTTATHPTFVADSNHHHTGEPANGKALALLSLTALGVVFLAFAYRLLPTARSPATTTDRRRPRRADPA